MREPTKYTFNKRAGKDVIQVLSTEISRRRGACCPEVHRLYFEPQYPEFSARTMWILSNAFTSAFKKIDPVPQFKRRRSWVNFSLNFLANRARFSIGNSLS